MVQPKSDWLYYQCQQQQTVRWPYSIWTIHYEDFLQLLYNKGETFRVYVAFSLQNDSAYLP